jgi:hypothetical protein
LERVTGKLHRSETNPTAGAHDAFLLILPKGFWAAGGIDRV